MPSLVEFGRGDGWGQSDSRWGDIAKASAVVTLVLLLLLAALVVLRAQISVFGTAIYGASGGASQLQKQSESENDFRRVSGPKPGKSSRQDKRLKSRDQ